MRWQLRDIVNFPVSEAVIDVFEIPEPARYVEARMVFAVAARAEAVNSIVELVKPRARGFDVIDIPELCLRNLSALLPQDERGVALLALGEGFAQLVITCQGGRTHDLSRLRALGRGAAQYLWDVRLCGAICRTHRDRRTVDSVQADITTSRSVAQVRNS